MTRGIPHPENLKPVQTADEAREKGRKGGLSSGVVRRRKALFRDILQDIMACKINSPFSWTPLPADEAICLAQVSKAAQGDTNAAAWCRDTMGQKPKEEIMGTVSLPVIVDDLISRPPTGAKQGTKRGKRKVK